MQSNDLGDKVCSARVRAWAAGEQEVIVGRKLEQVSGQDWLLYQPSSNPAGLS